MRRRGPGGEAGAWGGAGVPQALGAGGMAAEAAREAEAPQRRGEAGAGEDLVVVGEDIMALAEVVAAEDEEVAQAEQDEKLQELRQEGPGLGPDPAGGPTGRAGGCSVGAQLCGRPSYQALLAPQVQDESEAEFSPGSPEGRHIQGIPGHIFPPAGGAWLLWRITARRAAAEPRPRP